MPCLRLRYLRVRRWGWLFDSAQSLVPAVLEELVGAPGGFTALLVDVVGGCGHGGVGLAPGGHSFVKAMLGSLLGPFGDIRGAVEGHTPWL